jgi:hypothetical protein
MTLADLAVDIVPIVRLLRGEQDELLKLFVAAIVYGIRC